MDAGSTIHGIPQWEHPKQIGDEAVDGAPPFSPRRPGMIISNQLLPPRTPTTVSTTSQSTLQRTNISPKQGAEQSKRSPPNTSMDHRALLKMDGLSPDKMLIAFDSDSHSCCPSVGDITWDQSEAMAFQMSATHKHAPKSQQQQHPWQNFTELQPSSPRLAAKDRPPSATTASLTNRPTDPPVSPRRSKNQLTDFGKTHELKEKSKHQSPSKQSTDRASRSRTPKRREKGSQQQAVTVSPDDTMPPRASTAKPPMQKKFERNEIDLSFSLGNGAAVEKCPDEVNLAVLFRQKKERNRKEPPVPPVPPATTSTIARPKSRTRANARSRTNAPSEQYWPGTHGPSNATKPNRPAVPSVVQQEIHFVSGDAPSGPGSGMVTPDAIPAPKRSGPAAAGTRLHLDDAGSLTGTSWKKLNCSKSSLHSSSKHIEESIQSLETTLFGNLSTSTGASLLLNDAQKMEATRSGTIQMGQAAEDDEEGDDYDVVNEIVEDYIDFDTAMAMTSAIMED